MTEQTTSTVTVAYRLSEAGRRAAIAAGRPAAAYQTLDVSWEQLPELAREHVYVDDDGRAWLSLVRDTGLESRGVPYRASMRALEQGYDANCSAEYPDLDAPIDLDWLTALCERLPVELARLRAAKSQRDAEAAAERERDQAERRQLQERDIERLEADYSPALDPDGNWIHGQIPGTCIDSYHLDPALKQRLTAVRQRAQADIAASWTAAVGEVIDTIGSESQRQRWADGLLPEQESDALIRDHLYAPLRGRDRYLRLRPADLAHAEECDDPCPEITYDSGEADSLPEDAYATLRQLREIVATMPDAEITPRWHRATCDSCESEVTRYSARVAVKWHGRRFTREYAC